MSVENDNADSVINCGEDCEPPNTATCDANCKSTCTNCGNAKVPICSNEVRSRLRGN